MKNCGEVVVQLYVLQLGTRWRQVVSFTPWPFYPWGKSLKYHWSGFTWVDQKLMSAIVKRKIPPSASNHLPHSLVIIVTKPNVDNITLKSVQKNVNFINIIWHVAQKVFLSFCTGPCAHIQFNIRHK
jgi:hypothetical protein